VVTRGMMMRVASRFERPDLELQVRPGLELGPAIVELYMT